jgi:hypothetical protein
LVWKLRTGGLNGYSVGRVRISSNFPFCSSSASKSELRPPKISSYRVWRSRGALHGDFPFVQIRLVCETDFHALGRVSDQFTQFLEKSVIEHETRRLTYSALVYLGETLLTGHVDAVS